MGSLRRYFLVGNDSGLLDNSLQCSSPRPNLMDLNCNKTHCGKSLGSHQATLLWTFDDSLEGLSPWPSFNDGLWQQKIMGSRRFITPGHGCSWTSQKARKSMGITPMTKAMPLIKNVSSETIKRGNPMGQQ